jgi:hypothetical protein
VAAVDVAARLRVARARPLARRQELLLATGALGAAGVAAYARHILHGGWYMDDWRDASIAQYRSAGAALTWFVHYTAARPVLIAFLPLRHLLLGEHMHVDVALSVLLAVATSAGLYAVLRELGVAAQHAWLMAALALVFPFSDSTRLWATASLASGAIALYLAGAALSLRAVREDRRWPAHAACLALYAASLLTYEVSIAAIALTGALYLTAAPWRRVWRRWLADVAVALACGAWVISHTRYQTLTLAQQLVHAREILDGGLSVLAFAAQPFASSPSWHVVAVVVAAVLSCVSTVAGLAAVCDER